MANRKSLGSSPIGVPPDERDRLDFIPDLNGNGGGTSRAAGNSTQDGAAEPGPPPMRVRRDVKKLRRRKTAKSSPAADFHRKKTGSGEKNGTDDSNGTKSSADATGSEKKSTGSNKKIVSYYLEKDLIDRVKGMADDKGSYYSTLVSEALLKWVEKHGY